MHKGLAPTPDSPCYETSHCVYTKLFSFINDAAKAAKEVADVLVVSAFADVDALNDKVARAGSSAPDVDAWTAQVYRGSSFGNFFEGMGNATDKPVLLTEYGVDAYHDVCGAKLADDETPCFNIVGDNSGSHEDEEAQAAFAFNLTLEIYGAASDKPKCAGARTGWTNCTCIGGFLMSWVDEYWKGSKSQAGCSPTIRSPHFNAKKCDPKAHVTCGNWDTAVHDLCGYWLEAAPDHYVNEEWFGVTAPTQCESSVDGLRPRAAYYTMRELWSGLKPTDTSGPTFPACNELLEQRCVDLGDGGGRGVFGFWRTPVHAPLPCSGHGSCTSNFRECGPGGSEEIATPCCSCEFGFAGVGCEQLDARVYVAAAGAGVLLLLLLLMGTTSAASALCGTRGVSGDGLSDRLLS